MRSHIIFQFDDIAIYELAGSGDQTRIEILLSLFEQFFPQYRQYTPIMQQKVANFHHFYPSKIVHYWLVEIDKNPVGFRVFTYLQSRRCGLAHSMAVLPEYRRRSVNGLRLAMFLVKQCLKQLIEDSKKNDDPPVYGMINEVESDRLMDHYIRYGAIKLPVQYKEPILNSSESKPDDVTFADMHLGFLPAPQQEFAATDPNCLRNFVLAAMVDHHNLSENHPMVQSVLASIRSQ